MRGNVRVQRINISAIHWYDVKTALFRRLRRRIVLMQALVCAMLVSEGPMEPYARSVELVLTNWEMFA